MVNDEMRRAIERMTEMNNAPIRDALDHVTAAQRLAEENSIKKVFEALAPRSAMEEMLRQMEGAAVAAVQGMAGAESAKQWADTISKLAEEIRPPTIADALSSFGSIDFRPFPESHVDSYKPSPIRLPKDYTLADTFLEHLEEEIAEAQRQVIEGEQVTVLYFPPNGEPLVVNELSYYNPNLIRLRCTDSRATQTVVLAHMHAIQLILKVVKVGEPLLGRKLGFTIRRADVDRSIVDDPIGDTDNGL